LQPFLEVLKAITHANRDLLRPNQILVKKFITSNSLSYKHLLNIYTIYKLQPYINYMPL
jgi:hypothetical protein